MKTDSIIVLDFGGQYTHLIANRIRRLKVYSEIASPDADIAELKHATGIIFSGGPSSVYADDRPPFNDKILDLDLPILGLCYGHQLIAQHYGGNVKPGKTKEYGLSSVITSASPLFKGLDAGEVMWMSHGDSVSSLPAGFTTIGSTNDCPIAAMADDARKRYGLQFHPEVTHSVHGMQVLDNFLDICGCARTWTMDNVVKDLSASIRDTVGDRNVFLLVSGGVDSTVAFSLLNEALGPEKVYGLHVDTGLMRKNESADVLDFMHEHGYDNLDIVDASTQFLEALKGKYAPEEKRHIIGEMFVTVQQQELARLNLDPKKWMLGQGTIYPDTIESGGTKHAANIKTHHNRVRAIQDMIDRGMVIEPLQQLYKDEVRAVGSHLGIPHHLVWRHPFPGPALGVRALCTDGSDAAAPAEATEKVNNLCTAAGYTGQLLPIRSVGVQGDSRTYAHPAAVYGPRDWNTLEQLSTRITNTVKDANRTVFCLNHDAPAALRVKEAYITRNRMDLLREADHIAMSTLERHGRNEFVWQFPVVLVPLSRDGRQESIVLRPLHSTDAMTASFAILDDEIVDEMAKKIAALDGIDLVFYDVTHKPPATIEWE